MGLYSDSTFDFINVIKWEILEVSMGKDNHLTI